MAGYLPIEHRKWIIKQYWKTENVERVREKWTQLFDVPPPSRLSIYRLRDKFNETGSILDKPKSGRPVSVTTPENLIQVALAFTENPDTSKRRASLELEVSRRSLTRLMQNIGLKMYRPRLIHGLLEDDPDRRLQFCENILNEEREGEGILRKIVWSDEANFKLSGAVNKHNCVYYATENPHLTIETQLNQPGVTVWASISCKGVIGSIFFHTPVNMHNYLNMLKDTVVRTLREEYANGDFYFQQDGAPPHYALIVRDYLCTELPDKWIGRRGSIEWPPRSPDLTPMDFFFWGVVKHKVFAKKPKIKEENPIHKGSMQRD